ncbi:hypothetical protein RINTHH_15650 [Richelia intracellularis HH01]|uniref:Uncharacterized protein n=1 Tax=Richelia intracellularis HH01 TaxID=1165094 RepID=M1X302_9NOST|nr:hypothetical protein RINTHH_15650 [Richelia intracellularis HH01]
MRVSPKHSAGSVSIGLIRVGNALKFYLSQNDIFIINTNIMIIL